MDKSNMFEKQHSKNILKPEEKVLILLARQDLEEEDIDKLRLICKKQLDYIYLSKIAQKHGVAPLFGYHLSHNEQLKDIESLDEKFKKIMVLSNIITQAHNKKMYKELDRLQSLFEKENIKCVVLKGPGMSKLIYKYPGVRPFGDLDFLISPEDIVGVHKILINEGYVQDDGNPSIEELLKLAEREFHIPVYSKSNFHVEVHHYGVDWNLKSKVNYKSIYERAWKFKINNQSVWIPTYIDLFIWSCIHLEHHYLDTLTCSWPCGFKGGYSLPLKLLLDIRESYLFIANNTSLKKEFNSYIKNYSELIENNVVMTEQLYGNFFKWSNILPYPKRIVEKLTWQEGNICSYFINRFLSPTKEYGKLTDMLNEMDTRKAIPILYKGTNNRCDYLAIPSRQINNPFNFLFSKPLDTKIKIQARFNLEWDKNYLYFRLIISDNDIKYKYDLNYSFQILFGHSKVFPTIIGVDPTKSLEYCILSGRRENKWFNKNVTIIPEINFQYQECIITLKIPWDYVVVSPEAGNEMLMDVQITESKEGYSWDELQTISWSTGEKYHMNSFHNICEEFIMNKVKLEKISKNTNDNINDVFSDPLKRK